MGRSGTAAYRRASAIYIAGFCLLTGCAADPPPRVELAPDEVLLINFAVWQDYLGYLQKLKFGPGAYVVSDTGAAGGYAICGAPFRCYDTDYYTQSALRRCEREGEKCVLFAEQAHILVEYEVVDYQTPEYEIPAYEIPELEIPGFEIPDYEVPD